MMLNKMNSVISVSLWLIFLAERLLFFYHIFVIRRSSKFLSFRPNSQQRLFIFIF